MITDSELRISNESYTHKDFYQIYPEILDIVNKITERWDPASSNESDPGVVLLKLLAFVADKTNYNIDKNVLECFMPSATQEDSMRKLCDMMGYNMHYYNSATVDVSFMWTDSKLGNSTASKMIKIPRFTVLSDSSGEVNYVLTEEVNLIAQGQTVTKQAIEGQLIDLAINNGNTIKLLNLDDNRRLYLPESQIAENGIWIWNDTDEARSDIEKAVFWEKVDNLNTQPAHTRVWKFGYDSKKKLPYILFPEDVAELVGNGLRLKYIRTSGAAGNIKAKTLTKVADLTSLPYYINDVEQEGGAEIENDNGASNLVLQNNAYTLNGSDVETLDAAYNGFKKTIGTFDTLVTCRDYANKIYNLVVSNTNTNNLVSNVQVTDIRDDINFTNKVVTFNEYGLVYETFPVYKSYTTYATFADLPSAKDNVGKFAYVTVSQRYYEAVQIGPGSTSNDFAWEIVSEDALKTIDHFDLYIYPLNPTKAMTVNTEKTSGFSSKNYQNTFKPNSLSFYEITKQLENYKTISHNIKHIDLTDEANPLHNIYLIKNYYHLNAKISTSYKVTEYEGTQILRNIYAALYENFNSRKLDYGEEIPYDSLLKVIEQADVRIKSVALEEPKLTPVIMTGNGNEYNIASSDTGKSVYKNLIAKNVLAGKLPLFNYDTRFNYLIGQVQDSQSKSTIYGVERHYPYTSADTKPVVKVADMAKYSITHLTTGVDIPTSTSNGTGGYALNKNEIIQLIAPNLVSSQAFPAYVNYYFKYHADGTQQANIPCKLTQIIWSENQPNYNHYINAECTINATTYKMRSKLVYSNPSSASSCINEFNTKKAELSDLYGNHFPECKLWYYGAEYIQYNSVDNFPIADSTTVNQIVYDKSSDKYYIGTEKVVSGSYVYEWSVKIPDDYKYSESYIAGKVFYSVQPLTDSTFFILEGAYGINNCLYTTTGSSLSNIPGRLIDKKFNKYKRVTSNNFTGKDIYGKFETDDTLGITYDRPAIEANTDYKLVNGDILYINYTDTDEVVHNIEYHGPEQGTNCYFIENGQATQHEFSGIIRPSFKMYDSGAYATMGSGHRYSKTEGFLSSWQIEGMYTLQGTEQIDLRKFVETVIKTNPFYCYWITKNNNILTFTSNETADAAGKYYNFYYTLDNGEYFFYTDSMKNNLTTLGSGTTLKFYIKSGQQANTVEWKLQDNLDLNLDEVANEGIGAFSDTEWSNQPLTETKTLTIIENQIITLGEEDVITNVYFTDGSEVIDNSWKEINATEFRYNNDKSLPQFNNFSSEARWKMRSSLSLNVGPELTQTLYTDTNTGVKQWISLNTVAWKKANGEYVNVNKDMDLTKLKSERIPLGTDPSGKNPKQFSTGSIRTNYLLQELGGDYIPVTRFTIDGYEKDDLQLYQFKEEEPKSYGVVVIDDEHTTVKPLDLTLSDDFNKISFTQIKYACLPVFISSGNFGLIMFNYLPSSSAQGQSEDEYPTLQCYSSWDWTATDPGATAVTTPENIMYYKDSKETDISSEYKNKLKIKPGINIIRIKDGTYLKLERGTDTQGVVLFGNLDIVKLENDEETGINYSLLGIKQEETKSFLSTIQSLEGSQNFYYNAPISIYAQIDTNKFNEYSWFNYNNIANKFVLAELDADFSDIQIAKSSRANQW